MQLLETAVETALPNGEFVTPAVTSFRFSGNSTNLTLELSYFREGDVSKETFSILPCRNALKDTLKIL